MYEETKRSLIKVMGYLTDGKARTGLDIRLQPAWRKSTSGSNKRAIFSVVILGG